MILILIITLALFGIALIYLKVKDKNISDIALWVQAIATAILVIVTMSYVNETKRSRISQEQGFDKYVTELQEDRKQQVKPYVYVFFYWGGDRFGNKFFTVLKNFGAGPAFDIEYSYSVIDDKGLAVSHQDRCGALGSGMEAVDSTPFSLEHINIKNTVKIDVKYKDSFGQIFTDIFDQNLKELANNPLPCDLEERLRKISREESSFDKEVRDRAFFGTFKEIEIDLSEIKNSIKKLADK